MAQQGEHGIAWTDATWDPVRGCTRVSEGCRNCYAEAVAARFSGPGQAYEGLARSTPSGPRWTGEVRLVPEHLHDPLRWRKPRRVFVNSMSDLFHEELDDETIAAVFGVMALAPQHTYQVLTKRAKRMQTVVSRLTLGDAVAALYVLAPGTAERWPGDMDRMRAAGRRGWPLPHVWLGVSVEDQATADERIPHLLRTPAAVRFLSCEPLLGEINIRAHLMSGPDPAACQCGHGHGFSRCPNYGAVSATCHRCDCTQFRRVNGTHWVIVGGESGPGARPCDLEWVEGLVRQCRGAGVAVFVKQLGSVPVMDEHTWRAAPLTRLLSAANAERAPAGTVPLKFHDRKGGDPAELPEMLRVREFPAVEGAAP